MPARRRSVPRRGVPYRVLLPRRDDDHSGGHGNGDGDEHDNTGTTTSTTIAATATDAATGDTSIAGATTTAPLSETGSATDVLITTTLAVGTETGTAATETAVPIGGSTETGDGAEQGGGGGRGSKAAQVLYGEDVSVVYSSVIGVFALFALFLLFTRKRSRKAKSQTTVLQKLLAVVRSVAYRRFPVVDKMSAGVLGMIVVFWVVGLSMALAEKPYYNGAGDPPLGFIAFLTGYGYERLNVFHRQVSYLSFVFALIHVIAYILAPYKSGGAAAVADRFSSPGSPWASQYTGAPTFAIFSILAIPSIYFLRRKFYESFVLPHILSAFVFLGLLFWHVPRHYWPYLYAVCATWGLQLILRVFLKTRKATATIGSVDGEISKIIVSPPSMGKLRWSPGEHVFLRFPKSRPWENHPFTIASVAGGIPVSRRDIVGTRQSVVGDLNAVREGNGEMMFLIRSYKGMTRRIVKQVDGPRDSVEQPVLVDGPYGGYTEDMAKKYEKVILIAGGSGIAGVLAVFEVLANAAGRGGEEGNVLQRVDLVWMVSHREQLGWAQDKIDLIRAGAVSGAVSVETFVSARGQDVAEVPSDAESERGILGSDEGDREATPTTREKARDVGHSACEIIRGDGHGVTTRGRGSPRMGDLIPQMLFRDTRTCIIVCGPDGLIRDSANAVAREQKRVLSGELQEVSLRSQIFGW
ncbi:hypothetical protein MKZ38_001531 [Zalerion maritima]|uniref:FAD-binding FR-type domain-containing protein n=1 Tax=Zalerion maritima TaxID=339359 RepID=A0AAD5RQ63_9PEZI|nr:hypothetical protein MKZ38_001531 [Zalerion maritima]